MLTVPYVRITEASNALEAAHGRLLWSGHAEEMRTEAARTEIRLLEPHARALESQCAKAGSLVNVTADDQPVASGAVVSVTEADRPYLWVAFDSSPEE